jgi:hypothetical protein
MANEEMITAREFCMSHNIEISFVDELCEAGLLEVIREEDTVFISHDQLPDLEKLVRWHYEMDINLEGIEVINHLLQQMKEMQHQIQELKNKISIYE